MRKILNSLRLNEIKEKYYSESIKYLNSKINNAKFGRFDNNINICNNINNNNNITEVSQSDNLKKRHKVSKWFKNLLGLETEDNVNLKKGDKLNLKDKKEQDVCLSSFVPIDIDIKSASSLTPFATLLGDCHDKPIITVQNLMTTYFDKKRDTQMKKELRLQELQKELELMHRNKDQNSLSEFINDQTQELNAFHESEINPELGTASLIEIKTSNQIEGGDMLDYFDELSGHFTQTYIDQDTESIKSAQENNKSLDVDINPVTTALDHKTGEDKLLIEGLNKRLLDVVLQERTTQHENTRNPNDRSLAKNEADVFVNNSDEENYEIENENNKLTNVNADNFVEHDVLDWNLNAFDAAINSQHLTKEIFVDDKVYDQLLRDLYQLENKAIRPQSRFSVGSKPRIDYDRSPNIYDHHNENRAYSPDQYYRNQHVLNDGYHFKNNNSFRVDIDGFDNHSVASLSLTVSRPVKPLEYTYNKTNKNQRNWRNIEPSKLFEFNYNSLKNIPQVERLEKSLRGCTKNHKNQQSGLKENYNISQNPVLEFLDEIEKKDYGKKHPLLKYL